MGELGVPVAFAEEHAGVEGFGEVAQLQKLVDPLALLGCEQVLVGKAGAQSQVEVACARVVWLILRLLLVY